MRETSVKSADRSMALLEFFSDCQRPATVKEISQALGYPQSSTFMLLRSLAESGYYDHDVRTSTYAPNLRVLLATEWIGLKILSRHGVLGLMENVHRESGCTVAIGAQHGLRVRYLHVISAAARGQRIKTGDFRPLFHSASGRMLLTCLGAREVALLLRSINATEDNPDHRLTLEQALTTREEDKRNGYAISLGTSVKGHAAVAVLLPVSHGASPITLSAGGPLSRIRKDRDRLIEILKKFVAQ